MISLIDHQMVDQPLTTLKQWAEKAGF